MSSEQKALFKDLLEILTAKEIFGLNLDTNLVTLSACQTGINSIRPGDELIGLTRAILYAGAPSTLVSLWSVSSESTQELMVIFYKLIKEGKNKVEALQLSMLQTMEKYNHPYYWAPFILIGDWK